MTDKTISVYWFFILFIIASAMAFIVYTLYGKPLDVRGVEGIFLSEKVADCVSQGGKLSPEAEKLMGGGDILQVCHLNLEVEQFKDSWNNDQFYVSVNFSTVEGDKTLPVYSPIPVGNDNLKINSNVNFIDSSGKNMPLCISRTIYSNGKNGEYYLIKIFTCVRKTEKNV
jgi:hypothetical protein